MIHEFEKNVIFFLEMFYDILTSKWTIGEAHYGFCFLWIYI